MASLASTPYVLPWWVDPWQNQEYSLRVPQHHLLRLSQPVFLRVSRRLGRPMFQLLELLPCLPRLAQPMARAKAHLLSRLHGQVTLLHRCPQCIRRVPRQVVLATLLRVTRLLLRQSLLRTHQVPAPAIPRPHLRVLLRVRAQVKRLVVHRLDRQVHHPLTSRRRDLRPVRVILHLLFLQLDLPSLLWYTQRQVHPRHHP